MSAKKKNDGIKNYRLFLDKRPTRRKNGRSFLFILLNQLQAKNVAVFEINHAEF